MIENRQKSEAQLTKNPFINQAIKLKQELDSLASSTTHTPSQFEQVEVRLIEANDKAFNEFCYEIGELSNKSIEKHMPIELKEIIRPDQIIAETLQKDETLKSLFVRKYINQEHCTEQENNLLDKNKLANKLQIAVGEAIKNCEEKMPEFQTISVKLKAASKEAKHFREDEYQLMKPTFKSIRRKICHKIKKYLFNSYQEHNLNEVVQNLQKKLTPFTSTLSTAVAEDLKYSAKQDSIKAQKIPSKPDYRQFPPPMPERYR